MKITNQNGAYVFEMTPLSEMVFKLKILIVFKMLTNVEDALYGVNGVDDKKWSPMLKQLWHLMTHRVQSKQV